MQKKKEERTSSHFHRIGDPKLQDKITGKQRVLEGIFHFSSSSNQIPISHFTRTTYNNVQSPIK